MYELQLDKSSQGFFRVSRGGKLQLYDTYETMCRSLAHCIYTICIYLCTYHIDLNRFQNMAYIKKLRHIFKQNVGPSINDFTHLEESPKRWSYYISLFSKMGVKGEVKNLKKRVTSFMDGLQQKFEYMYHFYPFFQICIQT